MALRKRKLLTLKEKLNALVVIDQNPKRKLIDITSELGLLVLNANMIVSKRKEIEVNTLVFSAGTKQGCGAMHEELEALLKWSKQVRASGI